MTKSVNVHEAKTHLSRLLEEVAAGEDIVIAKAGVPVARLVSTSREPRELGFLAGVWPAVTADSPVFDPLTDEELAVWEGS
jgi:prevent-host-death family protein